MKMNKNTIAKVATLHNLFAKEVILDHYIYAKFYNMFKGEIPSWSTLKKHNLVVFKEVEIRFEEGFEEEFLPINVYTINF